MKVKYDKQTLQITSEFLHVHQQKPHYSTVSVHGSGHLAELSRSPGAYRRFLQL